MNGSMVEEPKWLNKLLESANNSRRGSLVTHTLDQNQNVIALKQAFARHQLVWSLKQFYSIVLAFVSQ